MRADRECFECCKNKVTGLLTQFGVTGEAYERTFAKTEQVMAQAGEDLTAPALMAKVLEIIEQVTGVMDVYEEPKKKYNQILLEKEVEIEREVLASEDVFLAGAQCAITGNYIDFGAMSDVNEEKLEELLADLAGIRLDEAELAAMRAELASASRLLYITDNAGEIVLDKIFLKIIRKLYPDLEVGVLVRGCPVLNDATMEDAKLIGLDEVAEVIPNGTNIPGTPIGLLSQEARAWMDAADLCIAKGQGNFETLRGCGRNIYYLFLCKCDLFVKKFGVERFTPVLSNETRIVQFA